MKTTDKERQVQRGGELVESMFGISKGDEAHILAILRDKLYSDKMLAVLREYTTNAMDAHVEAGCPDKPIDVTLPTRLEPELIIRDFGPGLSDDEVRNLYVMYGRSTKRNSNAVVGQLGLGCKAGFAYGDQFLVTSYHGGKKTTYNAYLDETNVGKIAQMSQEDTTEPEGIEIRIAVNSEHIIQFHQKAAYLFSFFPVKPNVKRLDSQYPIQDFSYWLEGKLDNGVCWGLQERNREPIAVMGGIPYKIDTRQFDFGDRGNYVMNHGIHIWFRIGDLQMAANREALEYTNKTTKHIKLVVKDVIEKISEAAKKKVEDAKTYREACLSYNKLLKEQVYRYFYSSKSISWRGEPVNGSILETTRPKEKRDTITGKTISTEEPNTKVQLVFLQNSWRGGKSITHLSQSWCDQIEVSPTTQIIEIDNPTKWRIKVEWFLHKRANNGQHDRDVFAVSFISEKERDKQFKKWHLDEWDIIKVSSLKDPPNDFKSSDAPSMSPKEKRKHTKRIFKLKAAYQTDPDRKSDNWEIIDVDIDNDTEERVFIEIDGFFPILWKQKGSYTTLHFLMAMVPVLGLKVDCIYGLKKSIIEKAAANKSWKRLDDILLEAILKQKSKLLQDVAREESLRQAPQSLKTYVHHLNKFPKGSPMYELLEYYKKLNEINNINKPDNDALKLLKMAGHDIKREAAKELDRLLDAVRKRYPILSSFRIFPDGFHYYLNDAQVESVIEYVKIIERESAEEQNDF